METKTNNKLNNVLNFFKEKKNIYLIIATFTGLLAIILFLLLPAVRLHLTPTGVSRVSGDPALAAYEVIITGSNLLFGGSAIDLLIQNEMADPELIQYTLLFNLFILIGLGLILAGIVTLIVLKILNKSNFINKIVLGLFIVGTLFVLLTPVFFYAGNPTVCASTYREPGSPVLKFEFINCDMAYGTVISLILGIIGSVFSGLLIYKPKE